MALRSELCPEPVHQEACEGYEDGHLHSAARSHATRCEATWAGPSCSFTWPAETSAVSASLSAVTLASIAAASIASVCRAQAIALKLGERAPGACYTFVRGSAGVWVPPDHHRQSAGVVSLLFWPQGSCCAAWEAHSRLPPVGWSAGHGKSW